MFRNLNIIIILSLIYSNIDVIFYQKIKKLITTYNKSPQNKIQQNLKKIQQNLKIDAEHRCRKTSRRWHNKLDISPFNL